MKFACQDFRLFVSASSEARNGGYLVIVSDKRALDAEVWLGGSKNWEKPMSDVSPRVPALDLPILFSMSPLEAQEGRHICT